MVSIKRWRIIAYLLIPKVFLFMIQRSVVVLSIMLCLLGGVLIYAITRSESIYLNQWLGHIDDGKVLHFFQSLVLNSHIPQGIIYSLPDALWMLALITTILCIWNFKLHRRSIRWIIIGLAAGLMFEILQAFHFIRGTFDIIDLIWMLIAGFIPIAFLKLKSYSWKTN